MPQRICKTAFEYAGRKLQPGERVEIEPKHITLLVGAGNIEREEGDVVPSYVSRDSAANWPGSYSTRAMTAAGSMTAASGMTSTRRIGGARRAS